jgi:thioredoxin reductase (NADPH)
MEHSCWSPRRPLVPIETDALIIGAGPVGLFQVFELGLLGIQAHVVDTLDHPGGQCAELYPDKPIYDIPALPVCTGRELVDRLLEQIKPLGATFHLCQQVASVQQREDGRFDVGTDKGQGFITKTIFVAGGAGAFQPRLLKVDGIAPFVGNQIFYSVKDPALFKGQHIAINGGGDTALDWALYFAQPGPHQAASVTLIHRRDGFQAAPAHVAKMKALCDDGQMQFNVGQITGFEAKNERLTHIHVTGMDGTTRTQALDALLVFFGLSPKLGPIADWGLSLERKQVVVDTEKFQTSVPGIFAVGDVNTYPGKKKLILCGFHEATLAAFAAAGIIFPHQPIALQYTTSSSKLHQVLGVQRPSDGIAND